MFMLPPDTLVVPPSDLAWRRPGHYLRGSHREGHPVPIRDWLHGRMGSYHGRTYPTGSHSLQAAPHCLYRRTAKKFSPIATLSAAA